MSQPDEMKPDSPSPADDDQPRTDEPSGAEQASAESFQGEPVEEPSGDDDYGLRLDDDTRTESCPECGAKVEFGTVLCVQCGLNLKSGKRVPVAEERSLADAGSRDLFSQESDDYSQPAWVYAAGLGSICTLAVLMWLLTPGVAIIVVGMAVFLAGAAASVISVGQWMGKESYAKPFHFLVGALMPFCRLVIKEERTDEQWEQTLVPTKILKWSIVIALLGLIVACAVLGLYIGGGEEG